MTLRCGLDGITAAVSAWDVVMWDETATMHRSAGDADPTQRRVMLGAAIDHALGAANYRSLRADEALIAQVIFRTQWL